MVMASAVHSEAAQNSFCDGTMHGEFTRPWLALGKFVPRSLTTNVQEPTCGRGPVPSMELYMQGNLSEIFTTVIGMYADPIVPGYCNRSSLRAQKQGGGGATVDIN
jgi:hypothetical protein